MEDASSAETASRPWDKARAIVVSSSEPGPHDRLAFQFVAACAFGCAALLADGKQASKPVRLSPRQQDVLRWVAEGLTVEQVADRLNVSRNTADTHLRLMRQRLGVTSNVQAVTTAFRLGLIS
ncbi:response regulator transcription factor [Mesorhizobium sp. Cs1321R2N1]|uniref:response regulator transcription factor n=1 Tax=Mesorhizobium sp. Cs1321R2N1 TaxID=3015174 RepID=UPI00301C324E